MKYHRCSESSFPSAWEKLWSLALPIVVLLGTLCLGGCKSADPNLPLAEALPPQDPQSVRLNPGDVVQISFPGAPTMNTSERVRLDGHINMPLIGDVQASGRTPIELQKDLVRLYGDQLQIKEVVVILASTSATIYVAGAVNHPGRIPLERPMTVLDAIMEAGGFDPKSANVKKVMVIRQKNGQYTRKYLNLRAVLKGENVPTFLVEPFDIVFVPQKVF